MRESYGEGVASHPGPQPCEGGREAALEALERGIRRQDIELRNQLIPGADAVRVVGRQHEGGRQRETALGPGKAGQARYFLFFWKRKAVTMPINRAELIEKIENNIRK